MYKFKGHGISFIDYFFKIHVECRLIEIPRDRDLFVAFWPFLEAFCCCCYTFHLYFSSLHMYLVQKFYSMSSDFYPEQCVYAGQIRSKEKVFCGSGSPSFPVQLKREVFRVLKIP